MERNKRTATVAAAAALAIGGVAALALSADPRDGNLVSADKPQVGLFTTLPIVLGDSASIGEALAGDAPVHWVRAELERDHRLVPLDTLEADAIAGVPHLVLAQPRPLAPSENVALDDWVRRGGRLLLFADPLLTEHSRFAIGDRRRPQDIALLSPILGRWGLELVFNEDQPEDGRAVVLDGISLPLRLAGTFRLVVAGAPARCHLRAEATVADCTIGQGRAYIIADAALLERDAGPASTGAFAALLSRAF